VSSRNVVEVYIKRALPMSLVAESNLLVKPELSLKK
jgi:hypothetical protein